MSFRDGERNPEQEMPTVKKWVDIVSFDPAKREGKVRARCVMEADGSLSFEGDDAMVARMKGGVYSAEQKRKLIPEDGESYLQALQLEFRTANLYATGMKQGEKVEEFVLPPAEDVVSADADAGEKET